MDYEKMYKAVLKTATQWIKDGCSDKEKICLESVFPELRESEDERIRARLIEYFQGFLEGYEDCYKDGGCVKWEGLDVKSILAYLERQKELPFVKDVVLGLPGLYFYDGERMHFGGSPAMEENPYDFAMSQQEKQKEQKHPNGCFTCDEYKKGYEEGRRNGFTAGYNKAMKEVEQKEQKPVKMEVYEVGKGTTVCGQDYKCKKDYKVGNCWYIKDAIYHCGRDGYLTDQNGISWSCTPEWFNEYIQSNTEWAEEEKTGFVSGQFLQCKLSFDGFKEGEHYWLEYVGDDMYVGRSDNILNQKFHITPRQLYTLFSQQLDEAQEPPKKEEQVSSEYETPMFEETPSDEQIIDALIHHLNEQDGFLTAINCVSTKAILSWLKKQKEQKSNIELIQKSWYMEGYHDKEFNCEPKWIIKTGEGGPRYEENPKYGQIIEQKPVEYLSKDKVYAIMSKLTKLSTSNLIPFNSPEYKKINEITSDVRSLLDYPIEQKPVVTHGETYHVDTLGTQQVIAGKMPQKPAEWSKEDKAIISCIVCCLDGQFVTEAARKQCLEWFNQHRRDFLNQSKQEWSEEDENKIESIKGLITMGKFVDTNTIKTIWKLLDSLRPQPKVEWSEEDERMLLSIIRDFAQGHKSSIGQEQWLKSLRPSWKPSEEQMEALKCAVADIARFSKRGGRQVELENEPYYSALHSLYCNLEKLM